MTQPSVAIIGAGIGGLTLAIELGQRGFPVTIFEKATEVERVGAGIVLAPNATYYLKQLGVLGALCQRGEILKGITIRTPRGRTLTQTAGKMTLGGLDFPMLALHRADLQSELLKTALRFQSTRLYMGAPLLDFHESEGGVSLIGPNGWEQFDLLVGADGVHSTVRQMLHGPSAPRYTNQISYRGIAEGDFSLQGKASETWGAGKRFGLVPLGENRVYWFAVLDATPGNHLPQERVLPFLKRQFQSFHAPIPEVLDASSQTVERDLADAKPLTRFSSDNVTLLGDAAHPMTPNLGQGAAQAIEDAAWLARILATSGDLPHLMGDALVCYDEVRIPRTTRFVEESRSMGELAHLKSPALRILRNLALRLVPQSIAERAQHKKLVAGIPQNAASFLAKRPQPVALLSAKITHGQTH